MNQVSPYLMTFLYDYVGARGTQEQLVAAAGLALSDPAAFSALTGSEEPSSSRLQALASLLPALEVLLDGVDVGELVLGTGFKGLLSTVIDANLAPPDLQPLLEELGPFIPYVISSYYECGGETEPFFDAINAVLANPVIQSVLENPALIGGGGSGGGSGGIPPQLQALIPTLYANVISNNPPIYNWLVTLPNQCIVDQGYIQPVAVIVTQGTMFETVGERLPKLVDDYYNAGCTTEQILAFAPVMLEAFGLPASEQTNTIFQKNGTTPSGETVRFTTPFNGGPSILQCLAPNLATLTTVLNVG
ncbi:hypothetical protein HOP50_05g39570 [Chloropicon primus]|nr:hypothetical protein HOP50_05g39570 [Chloropicon primus]